MKTINCMKQVTLVTVAFLGVGVLAAGGHASEPVPAANGRAVHYSDLNLNTTAGAKVLYGRIRSAAEQVCGVVDAKQLERAAVARACVDEAIAGSVRVVNSGRLSSIAKAQGDTAQTPINLASVR